MKNRIFKKYEILEKLYEIQIICNRKKHGITIKELKNELHKGEIKLIYDIIYLYCKKGLVNKNGAWGGRNTEIKINDNGINRIKWLWANRINEL